jgi:hypothetical protein
MSKILEDLDYLIEVNMIRTPFAIRSRNNPIGTKVNGIWKKVQPTQMGAIGKIKSRFSIPRKTPTQMKPIVNNNLPSKIITSTSQSFGKNNKLRTGNYLGFDNFQRQTRSFINV